MIAALVDEFEMFNDIAIQIERIAAKAHNRNRDIDAGMLRASALDGLAKARAGWSPERGMPFEHYASMLVKQSVYKVVMGERRRRGRFITWPVDEATGKNYDLPDERQNSHGWKIDHDMVRGALTTLPPRERKAVEMYHFDGKILKEIAAEFELSVEGARQVVERGIKKLREILKVGVERPERVSYKRHRSIDI